MKKQLNPEQQNLVLENINLVKSIANKYRGNGIPFSDLCQDGYYAMCLAALNFDSLKNAKFVTYAHHCVECHIKEIVKREKNNNSFLRSLSEDDLYPPSDAVDAYTEKDFLKRLTPLSDENRYIVKSYIGIGAPKKNIIELAMELGRERRTIGRILKNSVDIINS